MASVLPAGTSLHGSTFAAMDQRLYLLDGPPDAIRDVIRTRTGDAGIAGRSKTGTGGFWAYDLGAETWSDLTDSVTAVGYDKVYVKDPAAQEWVLPVWTATPGVWMRPDAKLLAVGGELFIVHGLDSIKPLPPSLPRSLPPSLPPVRSA